MALLYPDSGAHFQGSRRKKGDGRKTFISTAKGKPVLSVQEIVMTGTSRTNDKHIHINLV